MKRVVIKLSSPRDGNRRCDRIRITTPERTVPIRKIRTVENFKIMKTPEHNKSCNPTEREIQLKALDSNFSRETRGLNGEETQVNGISRKDVEEDNVKAVCEDCGKIWELNELESELHTKEKDLSSTRVEVEMLRTRLEEELIERFKVEDELSSEREIRGNEIKRLRERIEDLEQSDTEAYQKIHELENEIEVLTSEQEKGLEEIGQLKALLEKMVSESSRLVENENIANDRTVEALHEIEVWKKKAQQSAEKREQSRSFLEEEIECYQNKLSELKETLEEEKLNNSQKDCRLKDLESEICDYKNQLEDISEATVSDKSCIDSKALLNSSKDKELLELSHELNDMYREHFSYQEKFFALERVLISTQNDLNEVRNQSESQNIEVQNYKEKYAELSDIVMATRQDNSHLRNCLEHKCKENRELNKKYIIIETESVWLREALGIVKSSTRAV